MTTSFKYYKDHYVPKDGQKYYANHRFDKRKSVVAVVFPFFNEEYYELERSLISMYKQELECERNLRTEYHCVAIMDGWSKASDSMKDYISMLFPSKQNWPRKLITSKGNVGTLILQKVDEKNNVVRVKLNDEVSIRLTIVIKKDNRRKANSHEWFFRTFVDEYKAKYAFATD